ncbi:MAG: 2-hydroxyacyl-CoA dehydratase family protein [Deltaproteobacteria bacterium]
MSTVGFTTSIPVEVILAAGRIPVDLNNIFIGSSQAHALVAATEEAGYPRNTCGWIKGLYAIALQEELDAIIAVMQGDCSNTLALMETLQLKDKNIIPFAFPFDRDRAHLEQAILRLAEGFGVDLGRVARVWDELKGVRSRLQELDRMTWQDNLVSGQENHFFLVSSSDFNRDPRSFDEDLIHFIDSARQRQPFKEHVRLAYIGVPPIYTDLYPYLESLGARVVFNEVQRQFSMPNPAEDIFQQYLDYTYPYGAFARLPDIEEQLELRQVDGIIHYTQTFCFRQIEDIVFREKLHLPFLTLEGDQPGQLDARSRLRLEAFVNMLK